LPVSFCAPHSLYCRIKGELWGFHLLRVQAGEGWRKKADFGKKLCGSSLPVSSLPLLRQDLIGTKGRNQEMNKEKGYVLQAHCLFVWVCGFFVCLFVCFLNCCHVVSAVICFQQNREPRLQHSLIIGYKDGDGSGGLDL